MEDAGGADACDAIVLDEIGIDETRAYQIKLSKWKQGALEAIMCPIFWYLLYICRVIRGPLRHFMAYVQKHSCKGECLFNLVTGKLDEFLDDFTKLFKNFNQITDAAFKLSGCDKLDAHDLAGLKTISHKLLCQQWATYQRRIYKPLQQYLAQVTVTS